MKLAFIEVAGFRGFRDKVRLDLASGFVVFTGRNGAGKSTLLDAVDFAITGTINKFSVRGARGGGLDQHIWWVGAGRAADHYVSIGLTNEQGELFIIRNSREHGRTPAASEILRHFCTDAQTSLEDLVQTTLIRDELIAALSLDLPEQARFSAVRAAIGSIGGLDYSARTAAIVSAANIAKDRLSGRVQDIQANLGRALSALTEARSAAERSSNVSEALQVLDSLDISLPTSVNERTEAVRNYVAEKKAALLEVEGALRRSEAIFPDLMHLDSIDAREELQASVAALREAVHDKAVADEALLRAAQLDDAERQNNEYASHMAALLEHGEAVGLQDGHCPLCRASRTFEEFVAALRFIRNQLSGIEQRLANTAAALAQARATSVAAEQSVKAAQDRRNQISTRREAVERELFYIREIYARHAFSGPADDPTRAEMALLAAQEELIRVERALFILEASGAIDRVATLEARIGALRKQVEEETAKLAEAEKAVETARQINTAAKTVSNEILSEQFDTVMPLLKELYRRLRPHTDWRDIEADFGGRVRASLNFTVGDGRNPQFLFSSGQRRAAGLAFLLSIHLSRRWCRWQSLLLDDPVQHIDDYRALNLVEVLAAIRRTGRQVIVAVEDPALADVLCRRLRSSVSEKGCRFDLRMSKNGSSEVAEKQDIYPMPRQVLRSARAS